jgi:hypothetical protein
MVLSKIGKKAARKMIKIGDTLLLSHRPINGNHAIGEIGLNTCTKGSKANHSFGNNTKRFPKGTAKPMAIEKPKRSRNKLTSIYSNKIPFVSNSLNPFKTERGEGSRAGGYLPVLAR